MAAVEIPSDRTFREQEIRLTDLLEQGAMLIEDVTFERCTLLGPVVLFLDGTSLDQPLLEVPPSGPEGLLWEIRPEQRYLIGPVAMRNCHTVQCTFSAVGFAAHPPELALLRQHMGA